MKIRMLEYKKGSDGIKVTEYLIGKVYSVPNQISEYLAIAWLQKGICEIDRPVEAKIETKTIIPIETKGKTLIERAKELIKPGKSNQSIAKELGITVDELKRLKREMKK